MSEDSFDYHYMCVECVSCAVSIFWGRTEMPLDILQCTRQSPNTRKHPFQNLSGVAGEKPCLRTADVLLAFSSTINEH